MSAATAQAQATPSEPDPTGATNDRFFYGWVIVAVTFVAQFLTMGTVFYTFGVLLKPLTEALQTDRFLVSLALSIQLVWVSLLGPWLGKLVAERSIRALMLVGTALMTLGFLALSQVQELWQLYVVFGLILATGMALGGPLPNNALLANWFVRRRGTAFGISQLGVSLSGTAMVPLATWLVLEYGWRTTAVALAVAPAALMAPVVWLFVVKRPEERGLLPDGDPAGQALPEPDSEQEWTLRRALRDRRIWLLTLVVGPSFTAIGSVVQVMHSHITDLGLSGMQASAVIAAMTLMAALAKPLFGVLADHASKRGVMGLCLVLQMGGLALIQRADSYPELMAAGVLYGLGFGALMPLFGVLLGALFGRDAFARVMGLMAPLTLPFMLVGLPFATYVFERTGSYLPAFAAFLGFFAVSAVALAWLRLPERELAAR